MLTAKTPNCQQPLGRIIASRLFAAGARERLLEALEDLANGQVIAGKHAVEDAIDFIENGGRVENEIAAGLAYLPPVFDLDRALHVHRRNFLLGHAARAGWQAVWDGATFMVASDVIVTVFPNDVWTASSGMPDMNVSGVGLTSFHAHFRGQDLANTVMALLPWYEKHKSKPGHQ